MGSVFSYESSPANPDIKDTKVARRGLNFDDSSFNPIGRVSLESNDSNGEFMFSQTRGTANTLLHLGYHDFHGYESETTIGRYLGRMQWWYPYIGFDCHFKKEGVLQKDF